MKVTIIILLILLSISSASAATITGIVVDVTDTPIAGMPIQTGANYEKESYTTETAKDGSFSIESSDWFTLNPNKDNPYYFVTFHPELTPGNYKITYSTKEGKSTYESLKPDGTGIKFEDEHPHAARGIISGVAVGMLSLVGLIILAGSSPAWGTIVVIAGGLGLLIGGIAALLSGTDAGIPVHDLVSGIGQAGIDLSRELLSSTNPDGTPKDPVAERVAQIILDYAKELLGDTGIKVIGWLHFSIIFVLTFIAAQFIQKEADI